MNNMFLTKYANDRRITNYNAQAVIKQKDN